MSSAIIKMTRLAAGVKLPDEKEMKKSRGELKIAFEEPSPLMMSPDPEETTVAINGEYHETGYFQPVPPDAEVFFIPRIEGG